MPSEDSPGTTSAQTGDAASRRRVVVATTLVLLVLVALFRLPAAASYIGGDAPSRTADAYRKAYDAKARTNASALTGSGTTYRADGSHAHAGQAPGHRHDDPKTKNAVSRSAPVASGETVDPTSPAKAAADVRAAAQQRNQTEPRLTGAQVDAAQPSVPTNRYNLFNNCYALRAPNGRWLTSLSAPSFTAPSAAAASPLFFKPTELGRYLLYSTARSYLDGGAAALAYKASAPVLPGLPVDRTTSNWTVTQAGSSAFLFQIPKRGFLNVGPTGVATLAATGTPLRPVRTSGCTPFPEATTNVTGAPAAGITSYQEVRGYTDAHTHGMAFEFLGGDVHCGRPWSPWGVEVALTDCLDHTLTGGKGAVMEGFLSGDLDGHDPVGWPTFKDWPAPKSLTHEGTYYKWMERSWRAGQRLLVNLLVENNQLCTLYPLKRNSCNDMDSIRLQAKDMRLLENYIDAQHGGPGQGWYRIVTTPDEARRVINAGKMAVVMGIETSVPFGCSQKLGLPSCSKADIDRQLDEVRALGVTQMELVNKFDNALSGVAGDEGTTGYLVNAANTLETLSPWRMATCKTGDPEVHDKDQGNSVPVAVPADTQDALFGAVALVSGIKLPALPLYGAPHHCNSLGLSALGEHTIAGLAKRNMIFDPDHMSVKARKSALDLIDRLGYSGVVSSHSWSTPDAYPRIYGQKGFITPYAGDSTGFVAKWKRHLTWANPKTYWGIGYGADINGLGAQGDPRPGATKDRPVKYPFTGLGGVRVDRQISGERVYDINKDGVAQYGLYPDWIEDLRMLAGPAIVKDMYRGTEAYLQMWERAYGVKSNACTSPENRLTKSRLRSGARKGMTTWQVLRTLGQPDRRLGRTFSYCTTGARSEVTFTAAGRVDKVS